MIDAADGDDSADEDSPGTNATQSLGRMTPLHRIAGAGILARLQELLSEGSV